MGNGMFENESTPTLLNEDSMIRSLENFQMLYRGMKPEPPILLRSASTTCAPPFAHTPLQYEIRPTRRFEKAILPRRIRGLLCRIQEEK